MTLTGRLSALECRGERRSVRMPPGAMTRSLVHITMPAESPYTYQGPESLLAHYTDAAAAFEHILPDERLRMSPYHRMRDPVESQDILPTMTWSGDQPGDDLAPFEVLRHIKAARDSMRVLAFSRDARDGGPDIDPVFDCSWARPRMWEQYGDNHAGVCLLFDRTRLEAHVRTLGEDRTFIDEVSYDRQGIAASPMRHLSDVRIFDDAQRIDAVTEYVERYRHDFFFLKSDDFATEAEYRIVLRTDDEPAVGYTTDDQGFAYVGYGDALVAVVLGRHFPSWQRPGARAACDAAGVKMLRMWWERGRPFMLGRGETS
jgi:hypothetical protein